LLQAVGRLVPEKPGQFTLPDRDDTAGLAVRPPSVRLRFIKLPPAKWVCMEGTRLEQEHLMAELETLVRDARGGNLAAFALLVRGQGERILTGDPTGR
jgi:hypothetical protein